MTEFTPTSHEIEAMEIMAGLKPHPGNAAWLNAAIGFLSHAGYATRLGTLTDKGRKFLNDRASLST